MANRRAFKSDVSFLEKISIGATGTREVFDHLARLGHAPIELERGSMSFKIWKRIKIKRIRVPDLLCVACGTRIESRAKTALEISMSHSTTQPDRGWDFGLEDDDYVALVVCERSGPRPIDWRATGPIQFVSVRDLRAARAASKTKTTEPKGAEEGFEARITWPSSKASRDGQVVAVTLDRIQYRPIGTARPISLSLKKGAVRLTPLVAANDAVVKHQILASVVPIIRAFPCRRRVSDNQYISKLTSASHSDRYTAAKVLSRAPSADALAALLVRVQDPQEHIFVRLESAISLTRSRVDAGLAFIEACLSDEYLANRLEAVIALSELADEPATELLVRTLSSPGQDSDIQAGAAWALGQIGGRSPIAALVQSFAAISPDVRVEAARALAKIAARFTPDILQAFPESLPDTMAGISWAIAEASAFAVPDLLPFLRDDDARRWIAFIIGTQPPGVYVAQIEQLRQEDPEVYFAVTVLWQILNSWVSGLEEYG